MIKKEFSMFKKLFLIILCLFLPINFVFAAPSDDLQKIQDIVNTPEEKIDIAVVKLTIDKIIDPSVDINLYLKKLDQIYSKVQELAGDKKPNIKEINFLGPLAEKMSLRACEAMTSWRFPASHFN